MICHSILSHTNLFLKTELMHHRAAPAGISAATPAVPKLHDCNSYSTSKGAGAKVQVSNTRLSQ